MDGSLGYPDVRVGIAAILAILISIVMVYYLLVAIGWNVMSIIGERCVLPLQICLPYVGGITVLWIGAITMSVYLVDLSIVELHRIDTNRDGTNTPLIVHSGLKRLGA